MWGSLRLAPIMITYLRQILHVELVCEHCSSEEIGELQRQRCPVTVLTLHQVPNLQPHAIKKMHNCNFHLSLHKSWL